MSFDESLYASMANVHLAEELYDHYRNNPENVDPKWRGFFEEFDSVSEQALQRLQASQGQEVKRAAEQAVTKSSSESTEPKVQTLIREVSGGDLRIFNLIHAYRTYGHLLAKNNPIATHEPTSVPQLDPSMHGFRQEELVQYFPTCGLLAKENASLEDIIEVLQEIYCSKVGFQYMELGNMELEAWLQAKIEPNRCKVELSIEDKQMILQQLNKSELFESFLHTKYVGQKRFSLEGGETLIPIMRDIIESGANEGVQEFIIGMAHRGRLNVLSNILEKSYEDVFSEFEDSYIPGSFEGSGDVKYHKGYTAKSKTGKGHEVQITLTDNPSHLEAVNGIVEGIARAKQVELGDDVEMKRVVPILVHGDASISGQGIVYEVMQFCKLPGYSTGGTIHIVVNNQIGFTTLPKDSRSTRYCTDISRGFSAPVFHVSQEDPEGCIFATNLAVQLRQKFQCDVFICLNCYRKYGHNEGDEPAFTQPLEYQLIAKKQGIRELYRDQLIHAGVMEKYMAEVLEEEFKSSLQSALKGIQASTTKKKSQVKEEEKPKPIQNTFEEVKTGVLAKTMQKLAERFCSIPKGFNAHRKIQRLMKQRLAMVAADVDQAGIDWGMAEHLAYATLLKDGVHVRLSGQDSRRGTFSHRHAMWMDQVKEKKYFPLNHLMKNQGRFDVFNSPLSEYGVLGFEFGYSLAYPNSKSLVMWEAQFGDFSNGAQIIIDQFIATGEQKWGSSSNLVLLLPHGYEGQGPEHSSARIERFLQLSGDENMLVVNPTTPAQLFHLLRRQVIRNLHKPLIVFTPKGLLRHPACISSLSDLEKHTFMEILDDPKKVEKTRRILFCTGRIYYDLAEEREKREIKDVAIVRIEQLYPLNVEKIRELLVKYEGFEECYWVQEEPSNMGAWDFIRPQLQELFPKGMRLQYRGRGRSASPAVGSFGLHRKEHIALMNAVFDKGEQQLFEMSMDSMKT